MDINLTLLIAAIEIADKHAGRVRIYWQTLREDIFKKIPSLQQ